MFERLPGMKSSFHYSSIEAGSCNMRGANFDSSIPLQRPAHHAIEL